MDSIEDKSVAHTRQAIAECVRRARAQGWRFCLRKGHLLLLLLLLWVVGLLLSPLDPAILELRTRESRVHRRWILPTRTFFILCQMMPVAAVLAHGVHVFSWAFLGLWFGVNWVNNTVHMLVLRFLGSLAPPGSRLLGASKFLFSKKTYERVFLPVVADMQKEYLEALSEGDEWRASFIRLRATVVFLCHLFAQAPFSAARSFVLMLKLIA